MKDGKPLPLRRQSQEGLVHNHLWGGRGSGGAEESRFLTRMTEIMMLLFGMRSVTKRSDLGDR